MEAPRFTTEELWEIEESARSGLLNEDGALNDPGHWLGLVIDLSRALRHEKEVRLLGHTETMYYDFTALSK